METTNIVDFTRRDKMTDALTELLRTGAQDLIAQAVEAEFSVYMAQFSQLRTQAGHAAVVRALPSCLVCRGLLDFEG